MEAQVEEDQKEIDTEVKEANWRLRSHAADALIHGAHVVARGIGAESVADLAETDRDLAAAALDLDRLAARHLRAPARQAIDERAEQSGQNRGPDQRTQSGQHQGKQAYHGQQAEEERPAKNGTPASTETMRTARPSSRMKSRLDKC